MLAIFEKGLLMSMNAYAFQVAVQPYDSNLEAPPRSLILYACLTCSTLEGHQLPLVELGCTDMLPKDRGGTQEAQVAFLYCRMHNCPQPRSPPLRTVLRGTQCQAALNTYGPTQQSLFLKSDMDTRLFHDCWRCTSGWRLLLRYWRI